METPLLISGSPTVQRGSFGFEAIFSTSPASGSNKSLVGFVTIAAKYSPSMNAPVWNLMSPEKEVLNSPGLSIVGDRRQWAEGKSCGIYFLYDGFLQWTSHNSHLSALWNLHKPSSSLSTTPSVLVEIEE